MARRKTAQEPPRTYKVVRAVILAYMADRLMPTPGGAAWLARDMKSFTQNREDRWEGEPEDAESFVRQAHRDQAGGAWPNVFFFDTGRFVQERPLE